MTDSIEIHSSIWIKVLLTETGVYGFAPRAIKIGFDYLPQIELDSLKLNWIDLKKPCLFEFSMK